MNTILVGTGAAFGAVIRYSINLYFEKKTSSFPKATFLINLTGSFLLGIFSGMNLSNAVYLFLGTGMMGGYTTFSTFNFELFLLSKNDRQTFIRYFLGSYIGGLTVSFLGLVLGVFLKG